MMCTREGLGYLWVFILPGGQQEGEGLVGCVTSRGPPSSSPVNIAFTSGYKEGIVTLLRAVEEDDPFLVFLAITKYTPRGKMAHLSQI